MLEFPFSVSAGGDGNGPVRMQMIYVRKRQEGMQRCVDGSGDFVMAEGSKRIVVDHLIFVHFTFVEALQRFEAIQIELRKSRFLNRAEIASAPLYS